MGGGEGAIYFWAKLPAGGLSQGCCGWVFCVGVESCYPLLRPTVCGEAQHSAQCAGSWLLLAASAAQGGEW